MQGWIKLHRTIESWGWISEPYTAYTFIMMLIRASHNGNKIKGRSLNPGQLVLGYKEFSDKYGIPFQSFRTALQRLKSTQEITQEVTSQGSIITILNWDKYQCLTQELTNNQHASNTRVTPIKNVKNVKNVKKPEINKNIVHSVTFTYINDADIIKWVNSVSDAKRKEWLKKYNEKKLCEEIEKAYHYANANGKKYKNIASFLNNWFVSDYCNLQVIDQDEIEGVNNIKGYLNG